MLFKHINFDELTFVQAFFVSFEVQGVTGSFDCLPDAHEAASQASRAPGVVDPIDVHGFARMGKFGEPNLHHPELIRVAVSRWHNGDPIGMVLLGRVEQGKLNTTEWMGSMTVLIPPGFFSERGDPPVETVEEALRETFLSADITVGYRQGLNEPSVTLLWTDGSDVQCRMVSWMGSSPTHLSYREVFQREYTALAKRALRRFESPRLIHC